MRKNVDIKKIYFLKDKFPLKQKIKNGEIYIKILQI